MMGLLLCLLDVAFRARVLFLQCSTDYYFGHRIGVEFEHLGYQSKDVGWCLGVIMFESGHAAFLIVYIVCIDT